MERTSGNVHILLDYLLVAFGLASPWVFQFSHHTSATVFTLAGASFGLVLNLVTDYGGGLWKRLPFKWHRLIELASPPTFIGAPWLFFADAGAMPWVLTGIGTAIVVNALAFRPR